MRADYALSHLEDGEICTADTSQGERNLRWNKTEWRFYYADVPEATVCDFNQIEDWRIATIKQHPNSQAT